MPTDIPMTPGTPGGPEPAPRLVLWDVDQTLVRIGDGVSRALYERAFRQVTGRALGALAGMAGRTEQAIMTETLRLNGVERPESLFAEFYAALAAGAEQLAGRMREVGTVLPGAREAVAACAAQGAVQSTVTGNIRPVAVAKLAAVGLGADLDFAVGGYGDECADRAELVRRARGRAERKYGQDFSGTRTVVVGDTPHDVRGALDAGALAVAVASGSSPAEALCQAGAAAVLPTLHGFPASAF